MLDLLDMSAPPARAVPMRARQVTVVMRGDDARLSGEPVAAFVRYARRIVDAMVSA